MNLLLAEQAPGAADESQAEKRYNGFRREVAKLSDTQMQVNPNGQKGDGEGYPLMGILKISQQILFLVY